VVVVGREKRRDVAKAGQLAAKAGERRGIDIIVIIDQWQTSVGRDLPRIAACAKFPVKHRQGGDLHAEIATGDGEEGLVPVQFHVRSQPQHTTRAELIAP
jgi:hypothetical protein